jgi:uncharacterized protein (DUF1778 family)
MRLSIGKRTAMTGAAKNDARLNFRLASDLKRTIEEAAALTGQTVSEFAVSTLVRNARKVIDERRRMELSRRDRELFVKLLDQEAKPNKALVAAARKYKKQLD